MVLLVRSVILNLEAKRRKDLMKSTTLLSPNSRFGKTRQSRGVTYKKFLQVEFNLDWCDLTWIEKEI